MDGGAAPLPVTAGESDADSRSVASSDPPCFSLGVLPPEVLEILFGHCCAPELLVLACVSKAVFSELANADPLWHATFATRFAPVVRRLYDDEMPQPEVGQSWKQHYRAFAKGWMTATAHGAVLITIYGHVHDVTDCKSPRRLEWFAANHLAEKRASKAPMCGRARTHADLDEHPGDPQLLLAAAGRDATESFEYVGHSLNAHRQRGRRGPRL